MASVRMHICMASSGAPILPERSGAIEPYVWGLANQLSKYGNSVTVFGAGSGTVDDGNLRIRTLAYNEQTFRSLQESFGHLPINPQTIIFNKCLFKEIFGLHKIFPIDILHIHNIYSGSVANLCGHFLGVPVVCSIHNQIRFALPILIPNRASDKILPVSKFLSYFLMKNARIHPKKLEVLPIAVDPSEYECSKTTAEAKNELGLQRNLVILFVGRKCPEKGPQTLIQALPKIIRHNPNALAVLIGPDYFFGSNSTAYSQFLISLAKNLNVAQHVVLKGFISERNLKLFYRAADVVVCPSVWQEPLGKVIIEALAFEKPVIASSVGGIPEIISNNVNGLLTPPNNPSALADAVIYLLYNKEISLELGAKGRETVQKKFSFEVVAKQAIQIYEELL